MHYFPSTFDEMLLALCRIRHEAIRDHRALPRQIVLGRFEEMELLLADQSATPCEDRIAGRGSIAGIPYRVDRSRPRAFEIIPG